MSILFPLLPYFWVLLFIGALLAVIVSALRSRPRKPKAPKAVKEKVAKPKKEKKKKGKKKKGEPEEEVSEVDEFGEPQATEEQVLDFDEDFSKAQSR